MSDIRQLTTDERAMIQYFHTERGDLTRWVGWHAAQPVLERWHPEVLKALRDKEAADRILDLVIKAL